MSTSKADTAVLLMALGGPTSLDEVEPYLREVRGGRPTSPELVREFQERYRAIGGRSPLREISEAQARGLEQALSRSGPSVRVFVGMRHWRPTLREALERVSSEGTGNLVGVCLTPYRSRMTVGAYFEALERANATLASPLAIERVESWNTSPALSEAFAARVREGLERMRREGTTDPYVLFTAHSLPARVRSEGDPYETQLRETMELVKARLAPLRSSLAFQSAGRTPDPWLGPSVEESISALAAQKEKGVLVVPFGFISDNLEILYDVDREFTELAQSEGVHLARTTSLNDDPLLVRALSEAVRPHLASRGG
ncbi:MAG: ferrochelatase [Euryarchaeota archaeon]|nr:ferrochelatase [Euryarchaeota archaeon]MDE1835197.1 ferrochelatase [Euryarchaeota archaeon]MDE1880055.1 ferrochelatase [Euryarchaeota archaeon]MDE2045739.1 ferrochelatase [Thermoplasmata archaeon]